MSKLKLKNVGPIVGIDVSIPDNFRGVVLFRGGHGVGKSRGLEAVRAALGKKTRIIPREIVQDDESAATTGEIELGERKVKIGAKTTRTGEDTFSSIEDRFSIDDLIDPKVADSEARTDVRVKALIDVAGVKCGIEAFHEVVGGKAIMDALLGPKEQETPDLVALCGKIKRALEKQAQAEETRLESAESNARIAEGAAKDVDVTQPCDDTVLSKAFEEASANVAKLANQRNTFLAAKATADQATAKLTEHEKSAANLKELNARHEMALNAFKASSSIIVQLKEQLAKIQEQLKLAEADNDAKSAAVRTMAEMVGTAEQAEKAVDGWRAQIAEAAKLPNPTDELIAAAEAAKHDARKAMENGAVIRQAKAKLADAEKYRASAEEHRKMAEALRTKAAAVFSVLSSKIPKGPLYVHNGELVLDTADRKAEPFDRLSDGERTRIAVQYAVDAVGEGGMIVLSQPSWDGLLDESKAWVAKYSSDHDVITLAGEIADGPLRLEQYTAA